MRSSRKTTAYRKSRKFGDIYGGRVSPRVPDRIFKRAHSLARPGPMDETPILIQDNPSRNYFFPLSAEETLEALRALPQKHHQGITHLWLRRASQRDLEGGRLPLAEFMCGSGVRAIVLYPWRKDLRLCMGRLRPEGKHCRAYSKFGAEMVRSQGWWYVVFSLSDLRRFYIEHLLYHEVGHHVDWYRRYWGRANRRQGEEAADQYAVQWSKTAKYVFNRLEKARAADRGSPNHGL